MRKILLADPASITLFVFERHLRALDVRIDYVRYPRDLIAQARDRMPDVIFLDPEIMPGGRGRKIVDYLARRPETRQIPIVLITRMTENSIRDMSQWPGVAGLLRKPLHHRKLLEILETVLPQSTGSAPAEVQRDVI